MNTKFGLYYSRVVRSMWFRSTAFSLLAVIAALISMVATPYLPPGLSTKIGADALENILSIIASSMLAVTTFSLGIAVTAYNSAANAATPRATNLIVEDSTTQNVLATFVGAFLFSLIGIVVLRTGGYGEQGRLGLYVVTIILIILIVATLLRWISHLTTIGRMADTLERVERATQKAINSRLASPYLGCRPLADGYRLAHGNHPLHAAEIGYVQHIDTSALSECAHDWNMQLAISALPGTFADPGREVLFSEKPLSAKQTDEVLSCFTIGAARTFEQDPRFGIIVLSEIASRALSPGVNDPGTAIDVVGRLVRVLHSWDTGVSKGGEPEVNHPNLFAPGLRVADLFDDAFTSIARDASAMLEVHIRLQKAFATLATGATEDVREEAQRHASRSLERAVAGLQLASDVEKVRALHDAVLRSAPVA